MNCGNCGKSTSNPKFCSRKCATTRNNHLFPKRSRYSRHRPTRLCLECHVQFRPSKGSVGKVCSLACEIANRYTTWVRKVESSGRFPRTTNPTRCKRFLVDRFGHRCQICKRKMWLGRPINLVFDHIDGNSNNWEIPNCRLICNNCDSTLPTYKGRNLGHGRHARKLRYQQGKSY